MEEFCPTALSSIKKENFICKVSELYREDISKSYVSNRYNAGVLGDFNAVVECIHNLVDILLTKTIFIAIFDKTLARINHNNIFSVFCIFLIQYNQRSRNASSIKQVGWQTYNSFNVALLNNLFANVGF